MTSKLAITFLSNIIGNVYPNNLTGAPIVIRFVFYCLFILFFELIFYFDTSSKTKLIATGILTATVFVIKFLLWLFHILVNTSFEISDSMDSVDEERPDNIPPDIWLIRDKIYKCKGSLDFVITDLITSGVDAAGLMELVEYVQNGDHSAQALKKEEYKQQSVINICGKIYNLKLNAINIDMVFPSNSSIILVLSATFLCFGATYFSLQIIDQLSNREKWWAAFVCAVSMYSLLNPTEVDPYLTKFPDQWIGCARPLALFILTGLWTLAVYLDENYEKISLSNLIYDFQIEWALISPYANDVLRYGLLLMPFWMLLGYIGHPISVVISIIESFNRYVFGQNGVQGIVHLLVQDLRGVGSVAIIWAILNRKWDGLNLAISIAVATLFSSFPVFIHKEQLKEWIVTFGYPILLTGMSFVVTFCIVDITGNRWDIISWVTFGWMMLIDVIYPHITSHQGYFIMHCKMIGTIPGFIVVRNFTQLIIAPLFIMSALRDYKSNKFLIACAIVHSIQKSQTEPHIFAFAVWLTVVTIPTEFGLSSPAENLIVSLLIVSKLETFIPQAELICRSRRLGIFKIAKHVPFIITKILLEFASSFPLPDFIFKFPALTWSLFTGTSFSTDKGNPYFLSVAPIRPFYFFDWPVTDDHDLISVFTKNVSEHPIEAPVYTSVSRALKAQMASIVRSGRLGLVNAGNMFLFKADSLTVYVHIIAIEPTCIKIQIRGLEYNLQTICHENEDNRLQNVIENYHRFPNFGPAMIGSISVYNIRAFGIPLEMYDVTKTAVSAAFVGTRPSTVISLLLVSFCRCLSKGFIRMTDFRRIPPEFEEEARVYLLCRENMTTLLARTSTNLSENDLASLTDIFAMICMTILDTNGGFKASEIVEFFKGTINFRDDFSWIYSSPTLFADLVIPTVRRGIGLAFLASSGLIGEDDDIQQIADFAHDVGRSYTITTLESSQFQKTFFGQKKKKIIVLEKIRNEDTVLRFNMSSVSWNVFKLRHEWVRALWAADSQDILFYKNTNSERMSIQHDDCFLNNMILQACDFPVGYPAYVSKIMDSYVQPFSTQAFEPEAF